MTMSTSLGSLSVFPSWVMGEYGFDAMVLMLSLTWSHPRGSHIVAASALTCKLSNEIFRVPSPG